MDSAPQTPQPLASDGMVSLLQATSSINKRGSAGNGRSALQSNQSRDADLNKALHCSSAKCNPEVCGSTPEEVFKKLSADEQDDGAAVWNHLFNNKDTMKELTLKQVLWLQEPTTDLGLRKFNGMCIEDTWLFDKPTVDKPTDQNPYLMIQCSRKPGRVYEASSLSRITSYVTGGGARNTKEEQCESCACVTVNMDEWSNVRNDDFRVCEPAAVGREVSVGGLGGGPESCNEQGHLVR